VENAINHAKIVNLVWILRLVLLAKTFWLKEVTDYAVNVKMDFIRQQYLEHLHARNVQYNINNVFLGAKFVFINL
jgi:hypothetical protein